MTGSGRSFIYRSEYRRDLLFSLEDFPRIKTLQIFPLTLKFPGYSLTELVSQKCWAPNRMNVKGLYNGCSVLCENLNPESKCVPSPIQNFSQVHVHAHILTPSHCFCRVPEDQPSTCNMLRSIHEALSLEAYDWKGHRELVTGPLLPNHEEWTVEINFNDNSHSGLTCFAVSVRAAASALPSCCTIL